MSRMSTENRSPLKVFLFKATKQQRFVGGWDHCLNLKNTFN